jgi:hypothetical protein
LPQPKTDQHRKHQEESHAGPQRWTETKGTDLQAGKRHQQGDCYNDSFESIGNSIVWIKIIVVLAFLGIVISLASGLYFLVNDKSDSRRTLRALTWRVGLSMGLFLFIMILVGLDLIQPHGVYPGKPPG